ncbi:MAG: GNAT family N-acetyltransferase [Planctomycetota bacterium]|nr:GNAT family N-acetyltransferase [Planctomycetota bacterium]
MPVPTIVPVSTARQRRQFIELPWALHRGDPNWIPPLRAVHKGLVGYRPHPFYRTGQAQTFLAYCEDEVCGRVAAILNHDHNQYYAERRGFFGFFECIDDQEVAHGLLHAVREWFEARGIRHLRGPVNPGFEYSAGVLVEGFDSPPAFGMVHNPPHYPRLLEAFGFAKCEDLLAYQAHIQMLPAFTAGLRPLAQRIKERFDIRVRRLSRWQFFREAEEFLSVYNRSMVDHWGFYPMSREEILHLGRQFRFLMVPDFTLGAEIDGKLVGFAIGLPDYNPRLKQLDGRLWPFGFLRLLSRKRELQKLRIMAVNVIPEYQRLGIPLVLTDAMVPSVIEWGIQEIEYSWILESNPRSHANLEKVGTQLLKRYRIYDWNPPDDKVLLTEGQPR